MTCRVFTSADGGVRTIVCGRSKREPKRFCVVCAKAGRPTPASSLCDHEKPGGGTCDAGLCPAHTNRVREGVDWCPAHEEGS